MMSCDVTRDISQEKLGYEVELKGPGPSTPDAFIALSGSRVQVTNQHH